MSVSSTTNRATLVGNGATTTLSFPYELQTPNDLVVLAVTASTGAEATKVQTTHWTFSGTAVNGVYPSGGTITALTAPATGVTWVAYADPTATQGMNLVEGDGSPAEIMEQAHDRAALVSRRLREVMARSVRLADGVTASFDPKLPALAASNGGRALALNTAGDAFEWGYSEDDLDTAVTDAETAATAAAASASAASTSASAASSSASAASTSASAASTSASAASTSASAASTSASAAAASAALAAASSGWNTESGETHSAPESIAAAGTLTFTAGRIRVKKYVQGNGAARVLGTLQAGTIEGQELLIFGCHDTNTLEIDNPTNGITKGKAILADNDSILFNWDNTQAKWIEVARNN